MSRISFSEHSWEEYTYWQTQDKKTLKKINGLLKEIQRSPFVGEGKPELLKNRPGNIWSRRINDKDRLVYEVRENEIIIIQCKGHYDDK